MPSFFCKDTTIKKQEGFKIMNILIYNSYLIRQSTIVNRTSAFLHGESHKLFVRVHFDTDEIGDGEGDSADNRGFCLSYVQQPCTS